MLGASFSNIIGVISFEFLVVILSGCMIGGIAGYVMVDISMDAAWEYYEKVTFTTFGASLAIIFFLAVLTTGFKTVSTARMNPVKTLRDE